MTPFLCPAPNPLNKLKLFDNFSTGTTVYSSWEFSYISKQFGAEGRRVIFEVMSRFDLDDGLIRQYTEIFDIGIPMAQLSFPAERIARSLEKAAGRVRERHAGGVLFPNR